MAPPQPPGLLGVCASATVVATAATSVKSAIKEGKELVGNLFLITCEKCKARLKESDMPEHLELHRKEEEEKRELAHQLRLAELKLEELKIEKNTSDTPEHLELHRLEEEEKRLLAHKLRLTELKLEELRIEMKTNALTMVTQAQRREEELAKLKAQLETKCDICKQCVHWKDNKQHENLHRQANDDHIHNEDRISEMRQERNGRRDGKKGRGY